MATRTLQQMAPAALLCLKQVREKFDGPKFDGLVESVMQHGILQPLVAYRNDGKLILEDGERRLRAAIRAGLKVVPVLVCEEEHDQLTVLQNQLMFNCQREDLKPIEKAKAIDRLMREAKWSAAEVAIKLGMNQPSVCRSLKLLTLPESVRALVDSGRLPESSAYEIAQVEGADAQEQLAAEAVAKGLSREAIARKRREREVDPSTVKLGRKATLRAVAKLGGGRVVTVSGPGLSLETLIDWLETLLAKARKARPRGIEMSTFLRLLGDEAKAEAQP